MKNSAIETFCDSGIVFGLCASIFVLPASVAYLDSFAALAVFLYLLKKIYRIVIDWPIKSAHLSILSKICSVWNGFAPPENILDLPLQLLSSAIFISVIFSQYPTLSLLAFFGKFIKGVFVYFSFLEAIRDEKRIRLFITFFMASAFITAIFGVIQQLSGHDFIKGHHMSGGRISSFFKEANGLGAYLVPVIGVALNLLFTAFSRKKFWPLGSFLLVLVVLLFSCLCWSYSRSSWLGSLVILFVMVLLDRRKAFLAAALLLVFIFVFLPSLNSVRHLCLVTDNNVDRVQDGDLAALKHGGSGRLIFWKNAVSIIRSSPICGTGFNTYTRIIKRNPDKNTWWYAHNCYLQLAAETGVLGLGCFLWMLFILLRHGLIYCRKIKDIWPLTILQGTVAGLIGYLVQSFFDNTFYTSQLGLLMWLLIGLLVAVTRLTPAPQEKP